MESSEISGNKIVKICEKVLDSWSDFQPYVQTEPYNSPNYIWRGQRDSDWRLESGFDRFVKEASNPTLHKPDTLSDLSATKAARHLDRFKQAARGRRGESPNQPTSDDEWWALAQHNAMLTPLLDWTDSPFVALYFAFESNKVPTSGLRSVWALSTLIDSRDEGEKRLSTKRSRGKLDFIRPVQDDNSRLLNQAGLFTKVPPGTTVESWLAENAEIDLREVALTKFVIPDNGRKDCLRLLNRMNINHLSLFPDLYGAGKHCNNVLQIENY